MHPRWRWLATTWFVASLVPVPAVAGSLAERLHHFIDTRGFPTFGEFVEVVTPVVERLAVRSIDFPVTATSPAVSYRFNFDTGAFEPAPASLGPVFVERAETVGQKGRFDLGVSYLYANLTEFDGKAFGPQIVTAGKREDPATGLQVASAFAGTRFSVASHVTSFSATYGLSERWDVNLLVPLVATSLTLAGNSATILAVGGREVSARGAERFEGSAFGVGDVLLRTKYRFRDDPSAKLAGALTLRLPSGNEGDFHGLGDVTVYPAAVVSRPIRTHDVHGSLGVELNADDLQRTRARYAIGTTLQPVAKLAVLLDVIGSSSFVDDRFVIRAPAGQLFPEFSGLQDLVASRSAQRLVAFVPRSDVVDFAFGIRVNPLKTAVAFATAIVPITKDGLRAEAIGSAGVEVSF